MDKQELRNNLKVSMKDRYDERNEELPSLHRSFQSRPAFGNMSLNNTLGGFSRGDRSLLNDMNINLSTVKKKGPDQNVLIDTDIEVRIKSQQRESHCCYLHFNLERSESPSLQLDFRITNDSDLLFLQVLKISEEEFLKIKQDQRIKSDFQQFPEYISQFVSIAKTLNSNAYIQLELRKQNESVLSFGEKGAFKDMTILELIFRPSTGEELQTFLGSCLGHERDENKKLKECNTQYYEDIQLKSSELESLREQMKNFGKERDQAEDDLKNKANYQLNLQKEQYLEREKHIMHDMEKTKRETSEISKTRETELSQKVKDLEEKNRFLVENKMILEAEKKESNSKLKIMQNEYNSAKRESASLREENKKLDSLKYQYERRLIELEAKIEGMQNQISDKHGIINKNEKIIFQNDESLKNYQFQNEELRNKMIKNKKKLKESFEEINKANKIITELGGKLIDKKKKLKMKTSVIIKQENVVKEKKDRVDELKHEMMEIKNLLNEKTASLQIQESSVNSMKAMLEEATKRIKKQEEFSKYLQSQLNAKDSNNDSFVPKHSHNSYFHETKSTFNNYSYKRDRDLQGSLNYSSKIEKPLSILNMPKMSTISNVTNNQNYMSRSKSPNFLMRSSQTGYGNFTGVGRQSPLYSSEKDDMSRSGVNSEFFNKRTPNKISVVEFKGKHD